MSLIRRRAGATVAAVAAGAAAVLAAAGDARAQATGPAVPDPRETGVAPAAVPTPTVPPGPLAPTPETDAALDPKDAPPPSIAEPLIEGTAATAGTGTTQGPAGTAVIKRDTGHVPGSVVGVAVGVGGGVADFVTSEMRADTGVGGYWDVRAAAGTRKLIGVEAAYVGAAQPISGLGVTDPGTLVRNGAEADVRVNAPIHWRNILAEPYVFGGIGWAHYSVTGVSVPTASLASNDDVLTTPFGLGVAAGYGGFIFDVRGTYRPTFGEDLLTGTTNTDLTNWSIGGQLGYEF